MKKLISTIALMILCASSFAQSQLPYWAISPSEIDVQNTNVTNNPMPTVNLVNPPVPPPTITWTVTNSMYDQNGHILFYITNGSVYDYNNTLIGTIPNGGTEIAIVPFGDNDYVNFCQLKFNIFTTTGGMTGFTKLMQSVLDLNSFSISSDEIDEIQHGGLTSTEFGAIAMSKENGSDRYLYFLAGSGSNNNSGDIHKLVVDVHGAVSPPSVLFTGLGNEVFARELDLSHDGKYLAWASVDPGNRYHFLQLDGSGDYVPGSYNQFDIPAINGNNIPGFRGVEFIYHPVNGYELFMGAGTDGIYFTDIPATSAFTQVTNSGIGGYGLSQIELANNGLMYASQSGGTSVGAFDPTDPAPSILPIPFSFNLIAPMPPFAPFGGTPLYTLPDQIDNQDYSLIVPSALPSPTPMTINTITVNATTTWDYSNNPWNVTSLNQDAQVIKEIKVLSGKHLTIDGMTIKFSPDAKVVIEQGASLTLDGTVLTSDYLAHPCTIPYTWKGVEVLGNTAQSQLTAGAQGKLTLLNASRIEYAEIGAPVTGMVKRLILEND